MIWVMPNAAPTNQALHPPVGVRHVVLHGGKPLHDVVTRRQMTHRIGGAGIAGQCKGLAAAAAEIDFASRAAQAGLLHPVGAAKGFEGRRVCPDISKCVFANRPEFQTGDRFGGMARQHFAARCHIERTPPPAAHTRFGQPGMVIWHHSIDDDLAVMLAPQFLDGCGRAPDLLLRRHQGRAILQRPAVILRVRDLDPAGAETFASRREGAFRPSDSVV